MAPRYFVIPSPSWVVVLVLGLSMLAIALIFAAYNVGSEVGKIRGERNFHISNYERYAADDIKKICLNGQNGNVAECIAEVVNETNENQRAQDDLVAQIDMATWALWMLVVTLLTSFITLAGVTFVWLTLQETRRIGKLQTQAYCFVSGAVISFEDDIVPGYLFNVKVTIANSGNSPAKLNSLYAWVTTLPKTGGYGSQGWGASRYLPPNTTIETVISGNFEIHEIAVNGTTSKMLTVKLLTHISGVTSHGDAFSEDTIWRTSDIKVESIKDGRGYPFYPSQQSDQPIPEVREVIN